MEGFSDDEDADPTFQPGIDQTVEDDEDEDHEDDDQAPPPPLNAAAPQVPPFIFDPNAEWNELPDFDPLPGAPPYEPPRAVERKNPLDGFLRYVPNQLLNDIADATSQRILANTTKIFVVTPTILKKFIGINIKMSYMKYPRIRMYWAAKTRVPKIAYCMTRTNFFLIRSNLTCRDYLTVSQDEKSINKFWKIAPMINSVRSACLDNPRSINLSID